MELYHNNMSTCAQKVRLTLREKGVPHVERHINLRAGEQNTPAYRTLNPNGVVPTLVDHGQAIIESSVICEYLEDAYPQVALRPADPIERARMRLWTMQPDAGFHPAVGQTCMAIAFRHQILARGPEQVERMIAARPDPVMRERLRGLLDKGLDAPGVAQAIRRYDLFVEHMARQLDQSPWLAGNSFSLADVMAIPYIVRLEHLQCDWWWTEPQRNRQSVSAWLARCKARPSFAAITDYLDPDYMELMPRTGLQARVQIVAILAGANG